METIRLSRLNEFIQRVIALNFDAPLWISAELVSSKLNKGHYYLEIAERAEQEEIIAQASAVIWKSTWNSLSKKINQSILKEGNQLRLYILVDYHPKYGLKLNILDIDESYTLGEIAKQKQETITRLKGESLWQINKSTQLPLVIKNIAIITSMTSAGKKDFETHIVENNFAYTFHLRYFPATMQGKNTNGEVSQALQQIQELKDVHLDCIVIIRGGGAKLDLIDFDYYEIAKQISLSKIPVLTGIGHQQDESIADMNAFVALKTPTAVADYIIQHNLNFETSMRAQRDTIMNAIQYKINSSIDALGKHKNKLYLLFNQSIHRQQITLNQHTHSLLNLGSRNLHDRNMVLLKFAHLIETNNPIEILKKGYTISFQNNKRIKTIKDINTAYPLVTIFEDGKTTSIIKNE